MWSWNCLPRHPRLLDFQGDASEDSPLSCAHSSPDLLVFSITPLGELLIDVSHSTESLLALGRQIRGCIAHSGHVWDLGGALVGTACFPSMLWAHLHPQFSSHSSQHVLLVHAIRTETAPQQNPWRTLTLYQLWLRVWMSWEKGSPLGHRQAKLSCLSLT